MIIGVADDKRSARELIGEHLARAQYDVETWTDRSALETRFEAESPPRIVMLRWSLAGDDTPSLCRRLKARQRTYILALVERAECHQALEALADDRIDDALIMPVDTYALDVRLAVARRVLTLIDRLDRADARQERQSLQDTLTGMWNRNATLDFLRRELARGTRDGSPVGVVRLAVRGMTAINRAGGQRAGDRVLASVADTLRTAIRATDWAGRYSGTTFLIILPGCGAARAQSVGARLARMVGDRLEGSAPTGYDGLDSSAVSSAAADGEGADSVLARLSPDDVPDATVNPASVGPSSSPAR